MKLIPTQNPDMNYIESIILKCLEIGVIPYIENVLWVCNVNTKNITFKAWLIGQDISKQFIEVNSENLCIVEANSENLWNEDKGYVFIKADSSVIDISLIKDYSQDDYFISLLHKNISNETFKKSFFIAGMSPIISIKLDYNKVFYKNNTVSDIEKMSPVNPDNTGISFEAA